MTATLLSVNQYQRQGFFRVAHPLRFLEMSALTSDRAQAGLDEAGCCPAVFGSARAAPYLTRKQKTLNTKYTLESGFVPGLPSRSSSTMTQMLSDILPAIGLPPTLSDSISTSYLGMQLDGGHLRMFSRGLLTANYPARSGYSTIILLERDRATIPFIYSAANSLTKLLERSMIRIPS